ncbi:MAG: TlpA disulfide reductase family protein [Methylobacter sp.]|nr:TlpA disulfide reductase family protein [Methylobacter sp.]
MKQTGIIIIAAMIALGGGIAAQRFLPSMEKNSATSLPDFNLPDQFGNQHNISEWRGKILIINFWATWCPPCRKEIPEFIALQKQYSDKGVQFIGVALEEQKPVAEYASSAHINYPILISENDGIVLANQLGNNVGAIPYTIVVNQQGQIIHRHPGEFSKSQILEIINPLLD